MLAQLYSILDQPRFDICQLFAIVALVSVAASLYVYYRASNQPVIVYRKIVVYPPEQLSQTEWDDEAIAAGLWPKTK